MPDHGVFHLFWKNLGYARFTEGLTRFLGDVRIPLTNNDAERAVRQAVMGRKNFYGSRSIDAADFAATIYSVIESRKKVELDPKNFIKMAVLRAIRGQEAITPLDFAKSIRTESPGQ